jgi:hypothetical protein
MAKGVEICILYKTSEALIVATVPNEHQKAVSLLKVGHALHLLGSRSSSGCICRSPYPKQRSLLDRGWFISRLIFYSG